MRILFLFDKVNDDELAAGQLKPDSQTVRLFRYLSMRVKAIQPAAVLKMVLAAPSGTQAKAEEYRKHAEKLRPHIEEFGPDLIVSSGKSSLYTLEPWLPADFPKTVKFQRLFGREVAANGKPFRITFVPSPSMLYASKDQEGGYLYLRTFIEAVETALNTGGSQPHRLQSVHVTDRLTAERTLEQYLLSGKGLKAILQRRSGQDHKFVGVDTETTGLNTVGDTIRTIQLAFEDHTAFVFNFDVFLPSEWTAKLDQLSKAGWLPVLQNGKYDYKILLHNGVQLPPFHELSVAHVLIDERPWTHNLDTISMQILGEGKDEITKDSLVNGPIDAGDLTIQLQLKV